MKTTSLKIIPFSSIRLMSGNPQKAIAGAIGNEKGDFVVEAAYGTYDLIIESVGFEPITLKNQNLTKENPTVNLGTIKIKSSTKTLEEVTVKGQKASMELALDKRIFNVGTDLANKGATAAEILGNLPSVQVDGEGGVRLRGSENVRILVDGKPSTMVGMSGGGLAGLQGNLIDKVEIITNPFASGSVAVIFKSILVLDLAVSRRFFSSSIRRRSSAKRAFSSSMRLRS